MAGGSTPFCWTHEFKVNGVTYFNVCMYILVTEKMYLMDFHILDTGQPINVLCIATINVTLNISEKIVLL